MQEIFISLFFYVKLMCVARIFNADGTLPKITNEDNDDDDDDDDILISFIWNKQEERKWNAKYNIIIGFTEMPYRSYKDLH